MQLKILSWNIWYDGYFNEISKFLASFNADVIGLQEVVLSDPTRDTMRFLEKLGYHHVFAPVRTIKKDGRITGNAIFSKYPFINSEIYVLSDIENRNALKADIQVEGKILHIFSTHLIHTHQKPNSSQDSQVNNIIKIIPKDNTIVMGDFNAIPESNAIKKMSEIFINTNTKSLPTWSVYPEGCRICNPQKIDTCLDYIFTSKNIKTNSIKIHNVKGSDHLPISIVIDLPE